MSRRTNYGPIAPVFDCRYKRSDYSGVECALGAFLTSRTHLDVLDVGCGTGHWLKQLASPQNRIIGVDASEEMLGQARKKQVLAVVQAQAEVLPFQAGSFDRLFCANSFHHFTDKRHFVSEARRVLRPHGGFMAVSLDPHTGLDKWWVYDYFEKTLQLDRQRYVSRETTIEMLVSEGFVDCGTEVVQCFTAAVSARRSLERGNLAKTVTSQLAMLTDDEYHRGLNRIQDEIIAAERRGQDFLLISDLRLHATAGWLR